MIYRVNLLVLVIVLLVAGVIVSAQSETEPEISTPLVTVLSVEGETTLQRSGWRIPNVLVAGTLISEMDVVYSQNSELVIMCPDGSIETILPVDLLPVDILQCDVDPDTYIVGAAGERRIRVTRGGRQDPSIPYLISPRATLVHTSDIELRWHSPMNVLHYDVIVRGDGQIVWQLENIDPAQVVGDDIARLELPVTLEENVAYTVEICVLFQDLHSGCTTDPGWSTGADVAFYYQPAPNRHLAAQAIDQQLGANSPQALFAKAVLYSQPSQSPAGDDLIAYYALAVDLLEQLIDAYPNDPLATSPQTHNLLGTLYYSTYLPRSAAQTYQTAIDLSAPGTESAAVANLGFARIISQDAITYFDLAVEHYFALLEDEAFDSQLRAICELLGANCMQLARYEEIAGD